MLRITDRRLSWEYLKMVIIIIQHLYSALYKALKRCTYKNM